MISKSSGLTRIKTIKTISECVDSENIYLLEYDSIDNIFLISNIKINHSEIDTVVKSGFQINGMSEILDSKRQFISKTNILNSFQNFEILEAQKTLDEDILSLKIPNELKINEIVLKDNGFIAINQNHSF